MAPTQIRYPTRVESLRKAKGLTQTELAVEAGVSPGVVNRAENYGAESVGVERLADLARVLCVSVSSLVPGFQRVERVE